MGLCYKFNCKKCNYKLNVALGVGAFSTLRDYEKNIQAAINGELGKEIQKFLEENLGGEIGYVNVLKKCVKCGQYEIVQDLTMYLHDKKFFAKYPHRCKYCGGDVEIIDEDCFYENYRYSMKCPICHSKLVEDEMHGGICD